MLHTDFAQISPSPKWGRAPLEMMGPPRVQRMRQTPATWIPNFPAVFRTLEPKRPSETHISGLWDVPKTTPLFGFLRAVKRFLSNSFFIGSEIGWFNRFSGVFWSSALFRRLLADFFGTSILAVFRLHTHPARVQNGVCSGADSFFWIVYDQFEVYRACKRSVSCFTYSDSRIPEQQNSTFSDYADTNAARHRMSAYVERHTRGIRAESTSNWS